MALMTNFVGGAYQSRSRNMADEALVNLYVETTQQEGTAKRAMLIGTPGLRPLLTATDLGCRGVFTQNGLTIAVIGASVYAVDLVATTVTLLGTIANDGRRVSFASNGRAGEQIAMCGSGKLYILTTTSLALSAPIVLPFVGPVMVGFLDGYFLLLEAGSPTMWFSDLEDGTTWDALDFFTRSHTSDNLVGFVVVGGRIWQFGSQTIEVAYDSGDATTPFVPYPGSVLPYGAVSPWAIAVHGDTIVWLAQNGQSDRSVRSVTFGATTKALSTPAIDRLFAQASTVADVETEAYQQEGHAFILFTLPSAGSGGQTWGVDLVEQTWHQRGGYVQGQDVRWRGRGLCVVGGTILVGDATTGDLYVLDLDTYTDNGDLIRRRRRAPYLSAENQWVFLDAIELGIESGVGVGSGQGADPRLMLSVSTDSGHTFGPTMLAPMGKQGRYTERPIWTRLGRVRADRLVIDVAQTDPVKAIWGPGLFLRAQAGTAQL